MRTGLLIIIYWFPTTSANRCDASYSIRGRVLKNHTIATRPVEGIEECALLCVDYPDCHSINFYQRHKICDLNDKTHTSHPKDIICTFKLHGEYPQTIPVQPRLGMWLGVILLPIRDEMW